MKRVKLCRTEKRDLATDLKTAPAKFNILIYDISRVKHTV